MNKSLSYDDPFLGSDPETETGSDGPTVRGMNRIKIKGV